MAVPFDGIRMQYDNILDQVELLRILVRIASLYVMISVMLNNVKLPLQNSTLKDYESLIFYK
jgi:hypothetical protein